MDGNHPKNIDPHPKRRRAKDNPYELYTVGIHTGQPRFYIAFTDCEGIHRELEIDKALFETLNRFELDALSFLNEVDNHYEHSELTEASLNARAFCQPVTVEEIALQHFQNEQLHTAIAQLPEKQRARLILYYFGELTYEQIAEMDGNLFGDMSEFDGQHRLSSYNKTDQMKVEDEDSTFFNPKFSQLMTQKPVSEWIISVGRHEGFISSRKWVETQRMLDEIAEKYNRPHRKTNALLSGLMYCPVCGKRLRVISESNRWTNGKPRFKYVCPGVREKQCTFKAVEGVSLDEFVVHQLSILNDEHSDLYHQIFESRIASMIRTEQSEQEYQETKKAIERLNADIAAQVRNMRDADEALRRFIQDDIKELTEELSKKEAALRRMEDS